MSVQWTGELLGHLHEGHKRFQWSRRMMVEIYLLHQTEDLIQICLAFTDRALRNPASVVVKGRIAGGLTGANEFFSVKAECGGSD